MDQPLRVAPRAEGKMKQEIIVHVHQGRDLGIFTTRDFDGNGGGLGIG